MKRISEPIPANPARAPLWRQLALGDCRTPSLLLLLLYTAAHILVNGYQFAAEDLSLYIPYVPRYLDPALFDPADYFLILFSRTYTLFWIAAIPFVKLFGWEWTLFLLFIAVKFFTAWAIWSLAQFLTGDSRAAWLALLLLLVNRLVGGTMISQFESYPATRVVALPLVLFALRRIGERRMLAAAVLLGIAWNIHLFTALMFLFIGAAIALYDWRGLSGADAADSADIEEAADEALGKKNKTGVVHTVSTARTGNADSDPRPQTPEPPGVTRGKSAGTAQSGNSAPLLHNLVYPAAVFLLFALPLLIWKLLTPPLPVENFTDAEWFDVHRTRTAYCFLSLWPAQYWVKTSASLLFVLLGLRSFAAAGRLRQVVPALFAIGLLTLLQYFGADVLRKPALYQLQFSRALQYLDLLAMFGAAALIARQTRQRHGWCCALAGAVLLCGVLCWSTHWEYYVIGLLLLIMLAADPARRGAAPWVSALLLLFLLIQFCAQPSWDGAVFWPRVWLVYLLLAWGLLYCWLRFAHWTAALALPALLLISWYWVMPPDDRYSKNPIPIASPALNWPGQGMNSLWYDAQRWARENTAKDALFITPPYLRGWRMFSQRSCFGEWKDGAPALFDRAYAKGWRDHMSALGVWPPKNFEELARDYHSRPAEAWLQLARESGADYLLTERECDYPFPVAFRQGDVVIWKLE